MRYTHDAFAAPPTSIRLFESRRPTRTKARYRAQTRYSRYLSTEGLDVDFARPNSSGNFGRVYFGRYTQYQLDVVVKCPEDTELARTLYEMEVYTNRKLARKHSTISRYPKFLGELREPTTQRVGLVWLRENEGETLERYLCGFRLVQLANMLGVDSGGVPRRRLAAALLYELLTCVQQLQDSDIIHRDFKPENILVTPGTAPLKVIDFGSACEWSMLRKRNLENATIDPVYAPPERRLQVLRPADRFDMYSVGLIVLRAALPSLTDSKTMEQFVEGVLARNKYCFQRCVGNIVSDGGDEVASSLRQEMMQLDDERNSDLFSVLASLLTTRPEDRATVDSALRCRFLAVEGIPALDEGRLRLTER